jgi:hypothetical protein
VEIAVKILQEENVEIVEIVVKARRLGRELKAARGLDVVAENAEESAVLEAVEVVNLRWVGR